MRVRMSSSHRTQVGESSQNKLCLCMYVCVCMYVCMCVCGGATEERVSQRKAAQWKAFLLLVPEDVGRRGRLADREAGRQGKSDKAKRAVGGV